MKQGQSLMYVRYSDVYNMDGIDFEYLCADILVKNGFTNVRVTPPSGDFGVDVIAHKDGVSYGIQCKRWKWQVNFDAVKEAYAGIAHYKLDRAVVLTNSGYTSNAHEFARDANVILWGRNEFAAMFNRAYPEGGVNLKLPSENADSSSRNTYQTNYQPNYQQAYSQPRVYHITQKSKSSSGAGKVILWIIAAVVLLWLIIAGANSCGTNAAKSNSSSSSQSSSSSSSKNSGKNTNSSAKPAVQESLVDYVVYYKGAVTGVDESGKIAYYLTVQEKAGGQKITAIEDSAFAGCEKLKSINLPDTLTSIGEFAFSGCRSLTKIKLPDSLTYIGNNCFKGCTSLTEITIPKNVKSLSASTFKGSGVLKIHIPEGCTIPSGDDPFGLGSKCKIIWYDPDA